MSPAASSDLAPILESVPLFSCLDAAERETLSELLTEVSYRKGETICSEGEEGDTFFVIASGEVEVCTGTDPERVIRRLGPGDYLGEMALMLGGRRSATVRVARAARVLVLSRDAFERHFLRNPRIMEHVVRVLIQRLAVAHTREAAAKSALIIGVTAEGTPAGRSIVAAALAALLRDFSRRNVILVRISGPGAGARRGTPIRLTPTYGSAPRDRIKSELRLDGPGPAVLDVELDPSLGEEAVTQSLIPLTELGELAPYVILDVASELGEPAARSADEVCDVRVDIVEAPGSSGIRASQTPRHEVVNLFNQASAGIPLNHCSPYVIEVDPRIGNGDPLQVLERLRQHGRTWASLQRLTRKLLGGSVGIAVGGGAAFGIAHVGVFKVLEENDIPVDMLAGTSFGAIVALGYAAGIHASEMLEIAARIGNVRTTLSALDFTITRPGLLAGDRLIEIFGPFLGEIETFEQIQLPCRAVATDILSGERVDIGTGRLVEAFRASCSVPMIWSPVRHGDHVLVDGGIVDPVPSEVVYEMGADICIAVNVVPPLKEGVETVISRLYRQANRLNPLAYLGNSRELPNTLDIVMNTIQLLQYELGRFKSITADIRINPDLSGYTWVEFYKAEQLIERGAEATERALPEIKRVLSERMAAVSPVS